MGSSGLPWSEDYLHPSPVQPPEHPGTPLQNRQQWRFILRLPQKFLTLAKFQGVTKLSIAPQVVSAAATEFKQRLFRIDRKYHILSHCAESSW
jgi:hypothetical protein